MPKISLRTRIEGVVPRNQLPDPPRGYEWFLSTIQVPYQRRYTKEYPVIKYTYVKEPYRVRLYRYVKVRRKRRRKYYYITKHRRQRVYYVEYEKRKVIRTYKRREKWWVLRKKVKPVKEDWVVTMDYLREKFKTFGLKEDDVEVEIYPPFDLTEKNYQFNYHHRYLPLERTFDIIFLYYVIQLYKLKEKRYILVSSSFSLEGEYTFMQIIKNFIPLSIKQTITRINNARQGGVDISFVGYICFSAVKKMQLKEGKRS